MYRQQQQQPQQHRPAGGQEQWKSHSPHPPAPVTSWSGHHHQYHHHPYHSYPAAQQHQQQPTVHRPPMPPPVHYPSTHHTQHGQYPAQYAHQGAARYYHSSHGNHVSAHSPSGPTMTAAPTASASARPMQSQHGARPMHQPALVSPHHQHNVNANQATSSPISPQTVTSSPNASQRSPAAPVVAAQPTPVVAKSPNTATAANSTAPPLPPPLPPTNASSSSATNTNAVPPLPNNNMNIVTAKPPRPYTEYTMFYQLEREFILHRMLTTAEEAAKDPNSPANNNGMALFQNDPLMPARYRSLPLRADWYISGKSKKPTKRKHRKSHGKIGFLELTRLIASRWANVDDETRKYCKMMAAMELVKYKEDMESYNLYKDRLQAIGEMPEDMKERIAKKQKKREADKKKREAADNEKNKNDAAGALIVKAEPVGSSTTMVAHKSRVTTTGSINQVLPAPRPIVKLEPIAHNSPIMQESSEGMNLDNDMEKFISSLVQSPGQPQGTKKLLMTSPGANSKSKTMSKKTTSKTVTPERSNKKRKLFRDRPSLPTRSASGAVGGVPSLATSASARAAEEILVPLKVDGDGENCLEGIPLTFSGIDENEIAREFANNGTASVSSSPRVMTGRKMEPQMSYDYWDALVESTEL